MSESKRRLRPETVHELKAGIYKRLPKAEKGEYDALSKRILECEATVRQVDEVLERLTTPDIGAEDSAHQDLHDLRKQADDEATSKRGLLEVLILKLNFNYSHLASTSVRTTVGEAEAMRGGPDEGGD